MASISSIWPDSLKLQIALGNNSSPDGITSPTPHQYVLPCVKYEFSTPFTDGMKVGMDDEGILALIKSNSYKDALYLTTKLLSNIGQGIGMVLRPSTSQNTQSSLQIWTKRFQLMMALKYYSQLLDELSIFGDLDAADFYFQFYEKDSAKGSLLPFELRLLHAEAPSFSSNPYQSITRTQKLEVDTENALRMAQQSYPDGSGLLVWHKRLEEVRMKYAQILFRLKEFNKSLIAYEQILAQTTTEERRKTLIATLFRMAMHVGDEKRVNKFLDDLRNFYGEDSSEFAIHSSCKSIFDGDYAQALATLQQLKKKQPEICSNPFFVNNEAICLLYNGRALESLNSLFNHPGTIDEPLALNLSTVSDLVSTNSQALKQNYLAKHVQEKNDLFDPQIMRIS